MNNDLDFLNNDLEYLNDRYKTLVELWEKTVNVDLAEIRNSIALNSNDIVRLDTDITTTNQYNRRQNLIIELPPADAEWHSTRAWRKFSMSYSMRATTV